MRPLLVTACAFLLVLAPYEASIRVVEAHFGRSAQFGYPGTNTRKLEWFLTALEQRERFDTLIVGNSMCEYSINPIELKRARPDIGPEVYNAAFSASSMIGGLRVLNALELAPERVVICASTGDFSAYQNDYAQLLVEALAERMPGPERVFADICLEDLRECRARIERALAATFAEVVRSADPNYRRKLGDFLNLVAYPERIPRTLDELGRFLATGRTAREALADGRYHIGYSADGFLGLEMLKPWESDEVFAQLALDPLVAFYRQTIFPDYLANKERFFGEAAAEIAKLQRRGVQIVIVQLPEYATFAAGEEEATGFRAELQNFAAKAGVKLILSDQFAAGFMADKQNFRDAVHVHEASSVYVTARLAELL